MSDIKPRNIAWFWPLGKDTSTGLETWKQNRNNDKKKKTRNSQKRERQIKIPVFPNPGLI
jgi:hypothetical protein